MKISLACLDMLLADRQTDNHGTLKAKFIRHYVLCQNDISNKNYIKAIWFRIQVFWVVTSCRVMELLVNIYQSTGRNIREHLNANQYLARTANLARYITFALSIHNFCELRSFLTNCCEVKRLSVGQRTAVTEPRPTAHFPLSHSSASLPPLRSPPCWSSKRPTITQLLSGYIKPGRREDSSTQQTPQNGTYRRDLATGRVCKILVGVSLSDVAIFFRSGADYGIGRDLLLSAV
jgi:hypothetical protein